MNGRRSARRHAAVRVVDVLAVLVVLEELRVEDVLALALSGRGQIAERSATWAGKGCTRNFKGEPTAEPNDAMVE